MRHPWRGLGGLPRGIWILAADVAPAPLRGTYMGLYSMTFSAGFALGPWLGTLLLESEGPRVLWVSMFALGALSALLLGRVKTKNPAPEAAPEA